MSSIIRNRMNKQALAIARNTDNRLFELPAEQLAKIHNVHVDVIHMARDMAQKVNTGAFNRRGFSGSKS